ncbi:MAG: hypothetical protein ACXVYY_20205 [Oryzihumus sp.]
MRRQLEGPHLPTLVEQVRAEYGNSARIVSAERVRRGGVGGFFARERFHLVIEVTPRPGQVEVRSGVAPDGTVSGPVLAPPAPATSLLELADRVSAQEDALRAGAAPSPEVSTETPAFADVLARLHDTVAEAAAPVPRTAPRVFPDLTGRAEALGIPPTVLVGAHDPVVRYRRLAAWLESFPAPPLPAHAPGQVLALAGELPAALRVAGALAREIGAAQWDIFVVTPSPSSVQGVPLARVFGDAAAVAAQRRSWGQGRPSKVVVVDAPMLPDLRGWAHGVLAALAPTLTWGVVHASSKPGDVARWAARLGQVDALALEHVAATADPASVLTQCPVPVGLLDGRRATVEVWADLLTARLEAER